MNMIYTKLHSLFRFLCICFVAVLGLAAITGSGGGDSSSTEYQTVSTTFNFDTISVGYNASDPDPVTIACTPYTSMTNEFQETYPDETTGLTIVDGSVNAVEVKYTNAIWDSIGSEETIICESSLEGSLDEGILDATTIDAVNSPWTPAQNPSVFTNYIITDPKAEWRLCVQCQNNNLYNSYRLEYLTRLSLTLTVRETDQGATAE